MFKKCFNSQLGKKAGIIGGALALVVFLAVLVVFPSVDSFVYKLRSVVGFGGAA